MNTPTASNLQLAVLLSPVLLTFARDGCRSSSHPITPDTDVSGDLIEGGGASRQLRRAPPIRGAKPIANVIGTRLILALLILALAALVERVFVKATHTDPLSSHLSQARSLSP